MEDVTLNIRNECAGHRRLLLIFVSGRQAQSATRLCFSKFRAWDWRLQLSARHESRETNEDGQQSGHHHGSVRIAGVSDENGMLATCTSREAFALICAFNCRLTLNLAAFLFDD